MVTLVMRSPNSKADWNWFYYMIGKVSVILLKTAKAANSHCALTRCEVRQHNNLGEKRIKKILSNYGII